MMYIKDILDDFLLQQEVIGNSKQTVLYYKKRIGYFITFIENKDMKDLSINDYNRFAMYLKNKTTTKGNNLSSATIKTTLNAVKIFIKFCYNKGYLEDDFYKDIKPYKQIKKTVIVLNDEEINKLLCSQNQFSLIGCRNLLAISLMLDAGLRVSEVCNLDITDINKNLGLIRVFGKGQKERLVPLTDTIIEYYDRYLYLSGDISGALIKDINTGSRITPSGISQILRRIKYEYGFEKLHPHFLRHTFATLFLVNGGDPVHLQMILGHTTLYMTEQYLHLANQMTMERQKKFSPLSNIKKA